MRGSLFEDWIFLISKVISLLGGFASDSDELKIEFLSKEKYVLLNSLQNQYSSICN